MPKASRQSPSLKKRGRTGKRKTKEAGVKTEEGDDYDYTGEESDQSFGEEGDNLSDTDVSHRGRKRARSKTANSKDDRQRRATPVIAASLNSSSPSLDADSDYDEIGETKVDRGGNLLGGRQYKVPTFSLPNRGNMLFMFSKDPAALLGFRDSFVFLKKNPKLIKVHITDAEKGYLVQHNMLRSTFRTREVSVVTARSVYKQFGHRVLKKGRRGRDDYFYTGEVDEGDEGDYHSEDEGKHAADKQWSPVVVSGRNNLTSRTNKILAPAINDTNWMHHVALSIRNFNTQICEYRNENPSYYDVLTNVHQIPSAKQPLRLLYDISDKPVKKEKPSTQQPIEVPQAPASASSQPPLPASVQAAVPQQPSSQPPTMVQQSSGTMPMTSTPAAAATAVPTPPAVSMPPQVQQPQAPQQQQPPFTQPQMPQNQFAAQQAAMRQMQMQNPAMAAMYYQQMQQQAAAASRAGQPGPNNPMAQFHPQQRQMMMQGNNVFPPNASMAPMTSNPYQFMPPGGGTM
ncbi:chromatin structure-remodeling complex proteinrsc7 [Lichtheimia corymbifera JMRC:FSU:9682]|uniref:Chromatin structure-remodeling complex proteinrsc7 n=1 Tax=Lichtheimia corymbifera JMRC:FSU:9682 TaxID=1263082 RepID=A0A068S5W0_9FUNG|nr:chromatin structure-remodeling complex proteinrsc7 [Lichtheimia corymbifera JMRC:FSU:9682]